MYLQLSCRRFLLFVRERSGLRDRMKNKKIRCKRRKDIQAEKKPSLPLKLFIEPTYNRCASYVELEVRPDVI